MPGEAEAAAITGVKTTASWEDNVPLGVKISAPAGAHDEVLCIGLSHTSAHLTVSLCL